MKLNSKILLFIGFTLFTLSGCDKDSNTPTTTGNVAVISTNAVTNISLTSALGGGNVTDNSGLEVTAKGICWSTSGGPTIMLSTVTNDGFGNGTFASNMTGLSPGTTYYVRAYATNLAGTSYGNEVTFKTSLGKEPTVVTSSVSNTTITSVSSGGVVATDGGSEVTARGVCWDVNPGPEINLSTKTLDGSGTGNFTSKITGLKPSTTYYIRSYATNSTGTGYGNEVSFKTSDLVIGDNWGGGKVFYILNSGDPGYSSTVPHGLIVSSELGARQFGCNAIYTGGTSTALGKGLSNTNVIVNSCGTNTAAGLCSESKEGGFNDWYLPSWLELNILCSNKSSVGITSTSQHWSSSEYNSTNSWFYDFGGCGYSSDPKSVTKKVRAVRSF